VEVDELWDAVYLTQPEIAEVLDFAKANANHAWIYPSLAFAAHTGARRAEIIRFRF
jgi:hypothetical protein